MQETLTVISANLEYGGIAQDGEDSTALRETITALAKRNPDIVLLQEVNGRQPWLHNRRLCQTASALGMIPIQGPPTPMSLSGNRVAVLVNPEFELIDFGPYEYTDSYPVWCSAEIGIPGFPHPLDFYSVHFPPHSAVFQKMQAEWLATLVAKTGKLAVIGGDMNNYAPADCITSEDLASQSPHLGPGRMRWDGYERVINDDVHSAFTLAGLADAAPCITDRLESTGGQPKGRIDRFYVTQDFLITSALAQYSTMEIGSDHLAILLTADLRKLALAQPPGMAP